MHIIISSSMGITEEGLEQIKDYLYLSVVLTLTNNTKNE